MDAAARHAREPAAAPSGAADAPHLSTVSPLMDQEFIERNQVVERYLAGKLPPRGVSDFERYCRENPQLLDAIGLPERVNAGLRLLEAGGKPEPWAERPKRPWERPPVQIGLLAASFVLLVVAATLTRGYLARGERIGLLEQRIAEQPLAPTTATRTIKLIPSRKGPTSRPAVYVGGGSAQLIDLRIDLSWSKHQAFRVTIDRRGQGRVALVHNLQKDSNGDLRLALNSALFGPGEYPITIEGLTWRGELVPQAWITIGAQR